MPVAHAAWYPKDLHYIINGVVVRVRLVFFAFFIFPLIARGHEARSSEGFTIESLMRGVVRIENSVADVFDPERQDSHGTGFVVAPGLIFTNRHVIERDQLESQRLLVHFNVPNARPEAILAKLVFESPLHDFAVLTYDPKKLKRAKVKALRLPKAGSFYYEFSRNETLMVGKPALAIGNPYDSSNIFSYGAITGKHSDPHMGPYIQTQTPINPGNSGGPLISGETGEVLGINTSKIAGGDNVGFVTPIAPLLEEYELYRRQIAERTYPNASQQRSQPFSVEQVDEETLRLTGQHAAIKKAVPGYWAQAKDALVIADVFQGDLRKDDLLLKLDGQPIAGVPYNLFRILQRAGHVVTFTVLRGTQVLDVAVDMRGAGYNARRAEVDFVHISGLFFREFPVGLIPGFYPGIETRVTVQSILASAATTFNENAYPPAGSLLKAVNFGGEDLEIRSLTDFKRVLNANRDSKFIRLRVYKANRMKVGDREIELASPRTGGPLVDGQLMTYILPLRDVITPFQFSLHKFRKRFDFSNTGADTWDWRDAVQADRLPGACGARLKR